MMKKKRVEMKESKEERKKRKKKKINTQHDLTRTIYQP